MIVIAILAILVGLLVPQYTKYVEKTRKTADADNMDKLIRAFDMYIIDGGVVAKTTDKSYIIQINSSSSGTEGTGIVEAGKDDGISGLRDTLNEEMPGWQNLRTKSKKWGNNGKSASIKAFITVGDDGAISSITYEPAAFARFMNGRDKNK